MHLRPAAVEDGDHKVEAGGDPVCREQLRDHLLHGGLGVVQVLRDVGVAQAVAKQLKDFLLGLGNAWRHVDRGPWEITLLGLWCLLTL